MEDVKLAYYVLDPRTGEAVRNSREKPVRRCLSTAPVHGNQCQHRRKHNKTDLVITHQAGDLVWCDDGRHEHGESPVTKKINGAQPGGEQQLIDWWMGKAASEAERTIPKAVEYSATDLADIGHVLARTAGRKVSDEEAAELGVFFYLQGKLSRWAGAVAAGKRPSDDTIFDIGVYCRMAQRIRSAGNWPGLRSIKRN